MIELLQENEHLQLSLAEEFAMARKRNRKRKAQAMARKRKYEAKLTASGRCRRCPAQSQPGKALCKPCAAKESKRVLSYYARRK